MRGKVLSQRMCACLKFFGAYRNYKMQFVFMEKLEGCEGGDKGHCKDDMMAPTLHATRWGNF
jgi:hypothetical protein